MPRSGWKLEQERFPVDQTGMGGDMGHPVSHNAPPQYPPPITLVWHLDVLSRTIARYNHYAAHGNP